MLENDSNGKNDNNLHVSWLKCSNDFFLQNTNINPWLLAVQSVFSKFN